MKGLDYKTVKACHDAQDLLRKYGRCMPAKQGDRTYGLGYKGTDYSVKPPKDKYQVRYSQQEITIFPSDSYKGWQGDPQQYYPDRVTRHYFRSPWKEYIGVPDSADTKRFYITRPEGLRLQRDGAGYKVMNPLPDYRITVDRAKAREARKPAEDLYNFVDVLWDMLPEPENFGDRPDSFDPYAIPAVDDRDAWHAYVHAAKFARYGRLSKSTVLQKIRTEFTEKALAYSVVPVDNTRMDHTEHWDKLDELRQAGLLDVYEGKKAANSVG